MKDGEAKLPRKKAKQRKKSKPKKKTEIQNK
jgi:hypothetical protein